MTRKRTQEVISRSLLSDISRMIEEARSAVAVTVNAGLTILYWQIGKRIDQEILKGDRAEYGEEIVATLSRQLVERYGRGFAEKNLRRMVQFANSFPDAEIVAALSRQLSWSHFKEPVPLEEATPVRLLRRDVPC